MLLVFDLPEVRVLNPPASLQTLSMAIMVIGDWEVR